MSHPMRSRFVHVDWGKQFRQSVRPDRIMRPRPNIGAITRVLPRPGVSRIVPHPGVMLGILLLDMIPPFQPITAPMVKQVTLGWWQFNFSCDSANAGPNFGLGYCNGKSPTMPDGARMGFRAHLIPGWPGERMDLYNEVKHNVLPWWVADKAVQYVRNFSVTRPPYDWSPTMREMRWNANPNDLRVAPPRPITEPLPGRPARPVNDNPSRPFPRQVPAPRDIPNYRWDTAPAAGRAAPHVRAKPDRQTQERKVRSLANRLGVALFQALDTISESAEVVAALYDALPDDVKRRWGKGRDDRGYLDQWGQYGIDGADWKLQALAANWHKVDLEKGITNILKNALEDKIIGRIQRNLPPQLGQLSVEWNRKEGQAMMTVSQFVDWMVDKGKDGDSDAILAFYQELLAK